MPELNGLRGRAVLALNDADFGLWLDVNKVSIGGSDVGALMGVSQYKGPGDVWDRLFGLQREDGDNRYLERGRQLEPVALSLWDERWPERTLFRHPPKQYLGIYRADMDGKAFDYADVTNEEARTLVVETKVLSYSTFRQTREQGLDPNYFLQALEYMHVTGWTKTSFGILTPEQWEFHSFDVEFDPATWAIADAVCQRFWQEQVLTRTRPGNSVTSAADVRSIPRPGGDVVTRSDPRWVGLMARLKETRVARDLSARAYDATVEDVKLEMGEENQLVAGGGVRVSWKEGTRRTLNVERLMRALPDVDLNQFYDVAVSRTFTPTFERERT